MRLLTILSLTLLALVGCDSAAKRDLSSERDNPTYRTAMEDYRAGRIDAAVKGFTRVASEAPSNASARFQLGCLLQDSKKDFLGAYCAYREYLSQHPESDKAKIARERMVLCEKEMALELATKFRLNDTEALQKSIRELTKSKADVDKRYQLLEKDVETLRRRINSLSAERDRLLASLKADPDKPEDTPITVASEKHIVKQLLEEEESVERESAEKDVAKLRQEEKEEMETGSSILPARKPEDLSLRKAKEEEDDRRKRAAEEIARQNAHPDTYVVQEGDTLYKIAVRFYHHTSAWRKIRDANKAIISTDGRVKTGDTIKLPK